MREVFIRALTSGKHHIDFWWECSLEEGSDPTVFLAETPGAAHVLFVTDHTPVEPPDTGAGAPRRGAGLLGLRLRPDRAP